MDVRRVEAGGPSRIPLFDQTKREGVLEMFALLPSLEGAEDFQLEGSIRNPCDPPYVDGKEDRGFKQSGLSSNEEETDDCDCDPEEDNP